MINICFGKAMMLFVENIVRFFVENVPSPTTLVVAGPIALAWAAACLVFAGFLKTRRNFKTGYTRKIFHFLIFGTVVVVHRVWGTPGVCLFGAMTSVVIAYALLRGTGDEDDVRSREGQLKMFHNDPQCKVLIANPQACGEGISLHKVCHNAIYLDRTFNAAHYLQSMDRIHRLGLPKETETTIDIFVSKNTIDEPLINRLNTKIENMGKVLDDDSLLELVYDPSDIVEDVLDNQDIKIISDHIADGNA